MCKAVILRASLSCLSMQTYNTVVLTGIRIPSYFPPHPLFWAHWTNLLLALHSLYQLSRHCLNLHTGHVFGVGNCIGNNNCVTCGFWVHPHSPVHTYCGFKWKVLPQQLEKYKIFTEESEKRTRWCSSSATSRYQCIWQKPFHHQRRISLNQENL